KHVEDAKKRKRPQSARRALFFLAKHIRSFYFPLCMGLSKETLKNLFDVLKTVSLAITAVLIGLLSNVVLSSYRKTENAKSELLQLLSFQEQLKDNSANKIIDDAVILDHLPYKHLQLYSIFILDLNYPTEIQIDFPGLLDRTTGLPYK